MNIKTKAALAAALLAGAARAGALDWNADPVAQLRATLAAAPAAHAAPQGEAVPAATRLEGTMRGSRTLSHDFDAASDELSLEVNNAKDRVGASYQNCNGTTSGDGPVECDTAFAVFPQLAVDGRTIKLGDQVVAERGRFRGWHLVNGWRFSVTRVKVDWDDGFNHSTGKDKVTLLSIALEN